MDRGPADDHLDAWHRTGSPLLAVDGAEWRPDQHGKVLVT